MKFEELMHGDWVLFHDNPCRTDWVFSLLPESKVMFSGTCPNGDNVGTNCEESICPMPLTTEILQKNGFIQNVPDDKNAWFGLGCCYVHFGDELPFVNVGNDKMGNLDNAETVGTCVAEIKYVHELQRILRACNTGKDINKI